MKLIKIMVSGIFLSLGLSFSAHCAEWQQDAKGWWCVKDDGSFIKEDWLREGDNWYYFNSEGYMATGWIKINNKWYYMDDKGVMLKNTTKDGFNLAFDGSLLTSVRNQDKSILTDVQKRIIEKAIASLVDWHIDKKGLSETAVYKKDELCNNGVGILFNVLRHIDSNELFKTKRGFVSETDKDFTHSAVSVDEAIDVVNGLYACDFTKEELIEGIDLLRNSGNGFFTFDDYSYIAKEGVFGGNPIPKVEIEKSDLKDGYLRVSGKVSATAYDKSSGEILRKTYILNAGFAQNPSSVAAFTLDYISLK